METIFSQILAGEIPCEKVYEDDKVLAFLDINPVNPGHTLVIPKVWSENILDTDEEVVSYVAVIVKRIAPAILEAVGAKGFNVHINNGSVAGQEVMHSHWHIIPRFESDGVSMWPGKSYAQGEAAEVASKIRSLL